MHSTNGIDLFRSWLREIHLPRRRTSLRRSVNLAAVGYVAMDKVVEHLIEVENLLFVVLHRGSRPDSVPSLRLAGFRGSRIAWGVRWGGLGNSLFDKDFYLPPLLGARGRRLDLAQEDVVQLGLQLHRTLDRASRQFRRSAVWRLQLPRLWNAFETRLADRVTGDGPELAELSRRTGKPPETLLRETERRHLDLALFPLDWTSHWWRWSAAVFADLSTIPKRQSIRLRRLPGNLRGHRGAVEFDFYHTRFGNKSPRMKARHGGRHAAASSAIKSRQQCDVS